LERSFIMRTLSRTNKTLVVAITPLVLAAAMLFSYHISKDAIAHSARLLATQWALLQLILLGSLLVGDVLGPQGNAVIPRSAPLRVLAAFVASCSVLIPGTLGLAPELRTSGVGLALCVLLGACLALGHTLAFLLALRIVQTRVPRYATDVSRPAAFLGLLGFGTWGAFVFSKAWLIRNEVQGPAVVFRPLAEALTLGGSPVVPLVLTAVVSFALGGFAHWLRLPARQS
jgi:hypothetical protein